MTQPKPLDSSCESQSISSKAISIKDNDKPNSNTGLTSNHLESEKTHAYSKYSVKPESQSPPKQSKRKVKNQPNLVSYIEDYNIKVREVRES